MARFNPVAADRICFAVRGRGTQHFLSAAARAGVRLDGIRPGEEGLTAWAAGTDLPRLRRCADRGGWELEVVSRRGPGRSLARLLRRPGILAGLACFFMLVRLLSGFLWCMDFGGLTDAEQAAARLWPGTVCGRESGSAGKRWRGPSRRWTWREKPLAG